MHHPRTGPVEIRFFDPSTASPALWASYHRYRRQRAEEDLPGEPVLSDADFEHIVHKRWPLTTSQRFMALCDGAVVGNLYIESAREGSPDHEGRAPFIKVGGGVLQVDQRRGIATSLLHPLLAFMQAQHKRTATLDLHRPEAHAFMTALGATEKHRYCENRMPLDGVDRAELARWREQATRGRGLHWELHAGRVPIDRLAQLMDPFTRLINDIPLGVLDLPPMRYVLEDHVSWYQEMDRNGSTHLLALLIDDDHHVAAVCNAHCDGRFPDRVHQALTAVARPWRRQGLAKAVKAAMLDLVRDRLPAVRMIVTYNADVNAPMLSINERLGFALHRRNGSYQIDPQTLQRYLASR